jgi:hypothetical protein
VASGAQATIGGGGGNTASATAATVAGGSGNSANGSYSWVPGGLQADTRGLPGRAAWSAGCFAAPGDAQAGEFVLRRQTTDATAAVLTADGAAPGATNLVNLPAGATYAVRVMVAARQTGGSAGTIGDSALWARDFLVKRSANGAVTNITGVSQTPATPATSDSGASAWRVVHAPDSTQGGLSLSCTGEANKTINWVARILSVKVVG